MFIGKDRRHPRYKCDKCKKEIYYIGQKGFVGINHYHKSTQRETIKRDFDLCENCERKFRKWLSEKEILTLEEMINRFPIYEEKGE